jgi:hypothetical protein|tara:strand:- start:36 stop:908 length:873 start_codon:yes stop_codon:yes gene_type:complete
MAFKMKGFNPGAGTGMGSAFLKENEKSKLRQKLDAAQVKRKTEKAKKLRERAAELRAKKEGSKRADSLEKRAQSKETRAGVKEKMAKNVAAGKDKKADLVDARGRQTPGMKHRVDKPKVHDSKGDKVAGTGKKTSTPVAKSDAGSENMTFREAFRSARNAGKKEFTYKGKKYHTRTRSEEAAKKKKIGGKTKEEYDKMSPGEKAKFTMDNVYKKETYTGGSPKKISPKKMSPKKMSPKKMSPNKLEDKTSYAEARNERARLKKERENKRKKSTSFVDKTSIAYKRKMAGL